MAHITTTSSVFTRKTGVASVQRDVMFIRSQKKNAQLVYNGFIYNKKLTQANGHTTWRCCDVSKNRCRAVCTTKDNSLMDARRDHDHEAHWDRIANRMLYTQEEELDQHDVDQLVDASELRQQLRLAVDAAAEKQSPRKAYTRVSRASSALQS